MPEPGTAAAAVGEGAVAVIGRSPQRTASVRRLAAWLVT